ncbi:MAG: putative Ig domain-containing protein [Defluviicoccus sp.]|nr:putative Ig domain-containing protein [Defluviicoccus sp.]
MTGTLMLGAPPNVDLSVGTFGDVLFPTATGGVEPYTYALTCAGGSLPSGMSFAPATRRFAGTPGTRFRDSCTYSVTDSSAIAATVSQAVEIEVAGPVTGTLMLPASVVPGNVIRLRVGERARIAFRPATGGVQPYTYRLQCPDPSPIGPNVASQLPPPGLPPYDGLGFSPLTQVLSGTPNAAYTGPDCTYSVTDSATPPATLARSVALIIESERAKWRFPNNSRSLAQQDQSLDRAETDQQTIITLPAATGSPIQNDPMPVYRIPDVLGPRLSFDPQTRNLSYTHPQSNSLPQVGITATYRYQALFGDTVDDTLCIDVSFRKDADGDDDATNDPLFVSVRIRDDAYFDGAQYVCPISPLQPASASRAVQSNPVHEALGPVHARRALDVAHGAVRDRVRGWTPDAPRALTAITPHVGIGSLSGESDGFDYTGSSESASAGAEIGSGSWQAGLVGSYTRTELHYRAAAGLAERGYRSGEHATEILSLHPFAAWHMPSGGNLWTSLGAGTGQLRHRDDLGFPLWSRSDVHLRSYAVGGSVPVADILAGELEAEADVESFAFEIEGGGRISSALPTLRGRDWRAGLTWSAPVRGAPSLSVAYRHQTGDGPEGGQLEARGSVSVDGILDPRLSLVSNVEGAFGLGDHEYKSWGLSGGIRFVPGEDRRGLGVELDTRLVSPDGGGSADVGLRGEAGYGLRGGPLFPTVRPFAGVTRHSGDGSLRRSLGIDLRDRPHSRVRLEAWDRPRDRLRAIRASLRHRF